MELDADHEALLAGAVEGLASAVEAFELAAPAVELLRGICDLYQAHHDAPEHAQSPGAAQRPWPEQPRSQRGLQETPP